MVVRCTAMFVANYILTVESNSESENDDSLMEDDSDDSNEVNDA